MEYRYYANAWRKSKEVQESESERSDRNLSNDNTGHASFCLARIFFLEYLTAYCRLIERTGDHSPRKEKEDDATIHGVSQQLFVPAKEETV